MKQGLIILFTILITSPIMAQNPENQSSELPYYQIPAYPEEYSAATVAARMIDGLGFRYYWATEGLRDEDLKFRPNDEARTTDETLDHILGLSNTILNSVLKEPNVRGQERKELSFDEKRKQTLDNLKRTSDLLKASKPGEMNDFKIVFKNGDKETSYPFWNQINGPIADAIWHTGQVVSFRRSSGNPFNSKASLFNGKLRE
jgi:hypothetical protein